MKRGPQPDQEKDKKALSLRKRGFSYREIGKQMEISESMAFFRVKRAQKSVSKLSPIPS